MEKTLTGIIRAELRERFVKTTKADILDNIQYITEKTVATNDLARLDMIQSMLEEITKQI